jgi:hypothetical protein
VIGVIAAFGLLLYLVVALPKPEVFSWALTVAITMLRLALRRGATLGGEIA